MGPPPPCVVFYLPLLLNKILIYPHKKKFHSRCSFLVWTTTRNCILTVDNLQKKGHYLPNTCPLFLKDEESANHMLMHCFFTNEVWNVILIED